MERTTSILEAKEVLGSSFIGPKELKRISKNMAINIPIDIPPIPFSLKEIKERKGDYILILGASHMQNGEPLTINSLRNIFGIDPDISEPCFYNQDWYLKEKFIEEPLESKWYFIRKNVFHESRAKDPEEISKYYKFPTAVLCAYSFFANWFLNGEALWKHDFVWCNDLDHNGDRIYVGKYYDIKRINKNGFSIHRHLRIRDKYGAIEVR